MNTGQPDRPRNVTVICTTCDTPLHARLREQRQTIKCPNCHRRSTVPSRDEAASQSARKPAGASPAAEPYRLLSGNRVTGMPAEELPESVTIVCPVCQSRLDPDLKGLAYLYRCPDCHERVRVPSRREAEAGKRKQRASPAPSARGYTAGKAHQRPKLHTSYLQAQAEIRREPLDPPPRWTFFSGVFGFPWSPGAVQRWAFLAAGCTAFGLVVLVIDSMWRLLPDGYGGVAVAFFVLPAIWIAIWTFSYAAACCLPILLDTAAGIDRIVNWPEPVWKEWAQELVYVGFIGVQAITVGFGAAKLAELVASDSPGASGVLFWSVWAGSVYWLFPIFLLSSLEADSPFVPITGPVLRSLISLWWGWLLFYLLSGSLAACWIGLVAAGISGFPLLAVLLCGPLLAAVLFLYARLLGRLAWRAFLAEPTGLRRKTASTGSR